MKYIKIFPLIIIALSLITAGCSKNGAKEIVGKWKMDSTENQGNNPEFNAEIFYTFTKDTLIMEGDIHGQPLPMLKAPYVIKSDDGTNVVIEAEHPQSKQKGVFKIKVEGNKMSMTDPDNRPLSFTKQ
jgi:hypothetical protein